MGRAEALGWSYSSSPDAIRSGQYFYFLVSTALRRALPSLLQPFDDAPSSNGGAADSIITFTALRGQDLLKYMPQTQLRAPCRRSPWPAALAPSPLLSLSSDSITR